MEELQEYIENQMKYLWVDTCAEDSGKYTAYMDILNKIEELNKEE